MRIPVRVRLLPYCDSAGHQLLPLIALAAKKVAPPIASKKVRIPSKPYDLIFIKFVIRRSITFKNGIKFRKSLPRGRQGCR